MFNRLRYLVNSYPKGFLKVTHIEREVYFPVLDDLPPLEVELPKATPEIEVVYFGPLGPDDIPLRPERDDEADDDLLGLFI